MSERPFGVEEEPQESKNPIKRLVGRWQESREIKRRQEEIKFEFNRRKERTNSPDLRSRSRSSSETPLINLVREYWEISRKKEKDRLTVGLMIQDSVSVILAKDSPADAYEHRARAFDIEDYLDFLELSLEVDPEEGIVTPVVCDETRLYAAKMVRSLEERIETSQARDDFSLGADSYDLDFNIDEILKRLEKCEEQAKEKSLDERGYIPKIKDKVSEWKAILERRRREADNYYSGIQEKMKEAEQTGDPQKFLDSSILYRHFFERNIYRWLTKPIDPDEAARKEREVFSDGWLRLKEAVEMSVEPFGGTPVAASLLDTARNYLREYLSESNLGIPEKSKRNALQPIRTLLIRIEKDPTLQTPEVAASLGKINGELRGIIRAKVDRHYKLGEEWESLIEQIAERTARLIYVIQRPRDTRRLSEEEIFPEEEVPLESATPAEKEFRILTVGETLTMKDGNLYTIIEVLGGGQSVVYVVRNEKLDRVETLRAIKPVIEPDKKVREKKEKEEEERIERVGQLMTRVRAGMPAEIRAKVQEIHGLTQSEAGQKFLALEYMEGISLEEYWLAKEKRLEEKEVIRILRQVMEILDYVHRHKGFTHRDLKPSHIILSEDGQEVVGIIDWDLGMMAGENKDKLGSLEFSPPEQFIQGEKIGPLADSYPFGNMAYSFLTGEEPTGPNFKGMREERFPKIGSLSPKMQKFIENATLENGDPLKKLKRLPDGSEESIPLRASLGELLEILEGKP